MNASVACNQVLTDLQHVKELEIEELYSLSKNNVVNLFTLIKTPTSGDGKAIRPDSPNVQDSLCDNDSVSTSHSNESKTSSSSNWFQPIIAFDECGSDHDIEAQNMFSLEEEDIGLSRHSFGVHKQSEHSANTPTATYGGDFSSSPDDSTLSVAEVAHVAPFWSTLTSFSDHSNADLVAPSKPVDIEAQNPFITEVTSALLSQCDGEASKRSLKQVDRTKNWGVFSLSSIGLSSWFSEHSASRITSTRVDDSLSSSSDEESSVKPPKSPTTATTKPPPHWWAAVDDRFRRTIQYVYVLICLYIVPVSLALYAPPFYVTVLYFLSIGCVAFVNAWMICEAYASFRYTKKQRELHRSKPELVGDRRLGAIIAAYLPNELTVLIDTVKAISAQIDCLPATTTLDIVLSHNGGTKEQRIALLEDLRMIEKEIPDRVTVHELHVTSSRSKAENVNGALEFFEKLRKKTGSDFTQLAMYDADHQPIPEAYRYALETMQDQKANMVMGRCCVRDGFKFIAVEFDILYAVCHAGGRTVRGFGFFGGSNGYWDYKTLQETGMDEGMLTEDVDSSFRAQAAGNCMTYDPTIVSYEEAPPTLLALFKQRLRWSQGWAEVTLRQIRLPFRKAPGLTLWSRFCIFLLLPFRELYAYLSSFTVPIAVVYLTRGCGVACLDVRLLAFAFLCLMLPWYLTGAAWYLTKDRATNVHYRMPTMVARDYINFILLCYPYELCKIHVTVLGHARKFLGLNAWVVTKRKTSKNPEQPIFSPCEYVHSVERPESLVEDSPYAPEHRRLFAGTFDARACETKHSDEEAPFVSERFEF